MARRKKTNHERLEFSPAKRAREERSEKVRLAGSVLVIILLMGAVLGGLLFLNWMFDTVLFSKNDYFTLRKLDLASDGVLRPEAIQTYLAELGVEEGRVNLFALDLKDIRTRIKADNVLVKEAVFERVLPDTLKVSVREPRPHARLQTGLLLSREALALPGRSGGWTDDLPMLAGFKNSANLKVGDLFDAPMVLSSLHFLALVKVDHRTEFVKPLLVQPDYGEKSLKMYLAAAGPFRDQARLILPASYDKMPQALDRMHVIVQERHKARQTISYLDVTYEKNVPVRP
ncbi:MAG: FtsQ-type POTRA domain-containing protein [Lentisphaeria bacterium]|nr:FtsQ-type POTRA domain-containing protein [Lentisphaeria bacterium]